MARIRRKIVFLICILMILLQFTAPVSAVQEGSWSRVGFLEGEVEVTSLARSSTGTLYAGVQGTGPCQYENGDWFPLGKNESQPSSLALVTSLAVSSTGTLYAGTEEPKTTYWYDAVLDSWNKLGLNWPEGQSTNALVLSSTDTLYAAIGNMGVWQYTESGWAQLDDGFNHEVMSMAVSATDTLYAGTTDNEWVYAFNGSAWQTLGDATKPGAGVYSLALSDTGTIFAGTTNGGVWQYSAGAWFHLTGGDLPDGSRVNALVYDSTTRTLFAGMEDGLVYESVDQGLWHEIGKGLTGAVNSLLLGSLYSGTDDGVFRYNSPRPTGMPSLSSGALWALGVALVAAAALVLRFKKKKPI